MSRGCGGSEQDSTPIAKKDFEVVPSSGSSYYDTRQNAQSLVARGHAEWDGPKRVKLTQDRNIKTGWRVKQSGYAGPLVLQATV